MFWILECRILLVILVIALIVFGGGKLPEVMGSLGKGIREFKKSWGPFRSLRSSTSKGCGA